MKTPTLASALLSIATPVSFAELVDLGTGTKLMVSAPRAASSSQARDLVQPFRRMPLFTDFWHEKCADRRWFANWEDEPLESGWENMILKCAIPPV